jgi:hypothetical protein
MPGPSVGPSLPSLSFAGAALSTDRHDTLGSAALAWLVFLADPAPPGEPPSVRLRSKDAAPLLAAARLHGVLPTVLRGLNAAYPQFAELNGVRAAGRLVWSTAALSLALRHHGRRIIAALQSAGIGAAIVKGPAFADRIYPDPALRPFSDLDILVHPTDRAAVRELMPGLGFHAPGLRPLGEKDHREDQWVLAGQPAVLVEIQDDLVHSPNLVTRHRFGLADLLAAGEGDPTAAAAILLTATVHGAIGHQCDRLRFLVDICQAARNMPATSDWKSVRSLSDRCGILTGSAAALDLAARTFGGQACRLAADQLRAPSLQRAFCRAVWTPATVWHAQGPARRKGSWRRKLIREIVKHGK